MEHAGRISIVDDDVLVRGALSRLLKSAGYEVALFESAEAFLDADRDADGGCLVLDVHLPGRSGLDVQSELQAARKSLPIVFVTAYEDERTRSLALQRGAVEFLCKPLDTDRLLRVIEQALESAEG